MSVKVHGEPGHAVVSAFEQDVNAATNYVSRDPVRQAFQQQQHSSGASTSGRPPQPHQHQQSPTDFAAPASFETIQSRALRQLVHHTGINATYHRATERFAPAKLHAAAAVLQRMLQQNASTKASGLHIVAAGSSAAAELACLSHFVPRLACSALQLTVPYNTYGPEAAAVTAGVASVVTSLKHNNHISHLSINIQQLDYLRILQQGGVGTAQLQSLWGHVLAALRHAYQLNQTLREVTLDSPPGLLRPEDIALLQQALAASAQDQRANVLLCTHQRVGADSPLSLLPRDVLARIVEFAAPKTPGRLILSVPEWLPMDAVP